MLSELEFDGFCGIEFSLPFPKPDTSGVNTTADMRKLLESFSDSRAWVLPTRRALNVVFLLPLPL